MGISLEALTRSSKARQLGIDNTPSEEAKTLLPDFLTKVLEPICARWGEVDITSGYRCPALNAAIGGSATSDHCWHDEAIAADFVMRGHDLKDVYDWIRTTSIPFDQTFLEYALVNSVRQWRCIHISHRAISCRRQAGIKPTGGYGKVEWDVVGPEDA